MYIPDVPVTPDWSNPEMLDGSYSIPPQRCGMGRTIRVYSDSKYNDIASRCLCIVLLMGI